MSGVKLETVKNIFFQYDPSLSVEDFDVQVALVDKHYCSLTYKLKVHIKDKDGRQSLLPVFWKRTPNNPIRLQFVSFGQHFVLETAFYKTAIPDLMKPVGMNDLFPVFYGTWSNSETGECHIALKDISDESDKISHFTAVNKLVNGYRYIPCPREKRIEGLDLVHTKFVIQKMARLHAVSFIKYKGDGSALQAKYPDLKEQFWLKVEKLEGLCSSWVSNTHVRIKDALTQRNMEEYIPRVDSIMSVAHDTLAKLCEVSEKFPSVVIQGDLWTSNFMFKYDDKENPVDMKLIDFQLAKVTSRITDLSYLIYTSCRPEVVNKDIPALLNYYFEEFNHACVTFGNMQLPFFFKGKEMTWEYFLEEWEEYHRFGLISALLYSNVMHADPDNPPNMEDVSEEDMRKYEDNDEKENEDKKDKLWEFEPMLQFLFNLIVHHVKE